MTAASDSARAVEIADLLLAGIRIEPSINGGNPNRMAIVTALEHELARARRIGETSERLRCVLYLRELASEEDGATGASERVAEALEIAAQFVENGAIPQVKS